MCEFSDDAVSSETARSIGSSAAGMEWVSESASVVLYIVATFES